MSATHAIRRHIFNLSDTQLFNNREFLKYGTRALVDLVLFTMCRAGLIIREARGIYRKTPRTQVPAPTIDELALFKGQVYCRTVEKPMSTWAASFGLRGSPVHPGDEAQKPEAPTDTFVINSHSSSFATQRGRIYFKQQSARKVHLGHNWIAKIIKALWWKGKPLCPHDRWTTTCELGRKERFELRESQPLMPGWMSDAFHCTQETREEAQKARKQRELRERSASIFGIVAKYLNEEDKEIGATEEEYLDTDDNNEQPPPWFLGQ